MQLRAHTDIAGGLPQSGVPYGLIDDQLGSVRALIDKQLTGPAPHQNSPSLCVPFLVRGAEPIMPYLRKGICSGKMLRPGLVLLAGAACGKITDEHVRVAAIIEMIHNATLLHDDVIDEGQKRRGLATVNSLWGNEFAVLVGDFLLSRAFVMCADLEPQIIGVIAATTVRICEGELRQISRTKDCYGMAPPFASPAASTCVERRRGKQNEAAGLSESEYIDIITEKSAALFSSACLLGASLAQADETQVQALARFGLNVGIAFQITDDLLDIIGDEGETGKTLGSDVDKNKLTLAVIHLLGAVDDPAPIRQSLSSIGAGLAEMLSRYGSLEYARGRAQEFVGRAVEAIGMLEESDAKNALIETAEFAANRVT